MGLPLQLPLLAARFLRHTTESRCLLSAGIVHPATGSIAKDEKARRVTKMGPVKGWHLDLTGSSLQVRAAGLPRAPCSLSYCLGWPTLGSCTAWKGDDP